MGLNLGPLALVHMTLGEKGVTKAFVHNAHIALWFAHCSCHNDYHTCHVQRTLESSSSPGAKVSLTPLPQTSL